jgi:hypothetical protein
MATVTFNSFHKAGNYYYLVLNSDKMTITLTVKDTEKNVTKGCTITQKDIDNKSVPYNIFSWDHWSIICTLTEFLTDLKPTTVKYKGYVLRTTPKGTATSTLIYKGTLPIGGAFAMVGIEDSVEKAKLKVDYHIQHGTLNGFIKY